MIIKRKSIFGWLGLGSLLILAILILGKTTSQAQFDMPAAVTGVSLVPIQLGRDSYGLAMVDPRSESIWIYEINNKGAAHSRLKLFAARNWHYDKMLEEFNSAQPRPQEVKSMIEQMLKPGGATQSEANNVDITPLAEPNSKTEEKSKSE
jgi:hypothetical protein